MAITQAGTTLEFVTTGYGNTGTVSSTITVPDDAQIALVGWSGLGPGGVPNYFSTGSMTLTKNGVDTAMTAGTGGDSNDGLWQAACFYLVNPDRGTNKTLKFDWLGAAGPSATSGLCSITFWKGINTVTPVRDTDGAQAAGNPYTTPSLTCVVGDRIVAWVGAFTGSSGTVDTWSINGVTVSQVATATNSDGGWGTALPGGNTTFALVTDTNFDDGGIVAIVLEAAPDPSPGPMSCYPAVVTKIQMVGY